MIFNKNWKQYLFPQIFWSIIASWFGIILLYPLFAWFQKMDMNMFNNFSTNFLENSIQFLEPLSYMFLSIAIFITIGGMIQTYNISWHHDHREWMSYQDIMKLAWSRLWAWMWYSIWIILWVLALIIIWILVWLILWDLIWLYIFLAIILFYWALISCNVGFPEYIINNSSSPEKFPYFLSLTRWRWWRVFWNVFLVSIIISSVISVGQQFLFALIWGDILITKIMQWLQFLWTSTSTSSIFQNIFADISILTWIRIILGYSIILCIYHVQNIFIITFGYVLWKDITTELAWVPEKTIEE